MGCRWSGRALTCPPGCAEHAVLGRLVSGETHDDDSPECAICVPIAATVEPKATARLSGGRRQRCRPVGVRERSLSLPRFGGHVRYAEHTAAQEVIRCTD